MACLQRDVTDERRMDGMGRKNVWNVWNVRIRQSGYQVVRKSFMQTSTSVLHLVCLSRSEQESLSSTDATNVVRFSCTPAKTGASYRYLLGHPDSRVRREWLRFVHGRVSRKLTT